MKKTPLKLSALLVALFAAGGSTQGLASGFALIENSASGQGNAYAGAAAVAEDASTIWFNPAGMMKLKDDQIVVVGHFINPSSSFTNGDSTTPLPAPLDKLNGNDDDGGTGALVANFYWMKAISDQMKFGIGVTTPFGLTTLYDDTWRGRYHAVESDLKTININPSIAYEINDRLSVGGGINLMLADVTFTSMIDFGALCYAALTPSACNAQGNIPQQTDGFADLHADNFSDLSWGINLGLMFDITKDTTLGVAWRSETKVKVKGDGQFTVPASAGFAPAAGLFTNTGLRAEVTLPQSFSVSIAHDIDRLKLLADITWTGWSSFEELRIVYDNPNQPDSVTTEKWEDTFRYSIGADYELNSAWTVRGGLAYDETPVPSAELRTPRIPGNSRTWISLGASYSIDQAFVVDFGYSHLFVDDTPINNTFESSVPTLAATLNGTYKASVDILSAQLRWNY